jgi:hypothetical protein
MSTKKLTHTEQGAINRKSLLSLSVSPDTKPDSTRRELATFCQDVQKKLIMWRHLPELRLVLLEVEKEKENQK